jgi:hypothetical protein
MYTSFLIFFGANKRTVENIRALMVAVRKFAPADQSPGMQIMVESNVAVSRKYRGQRKLI